MNFKSFASLALGLMMALLTSAHAGDRAYVQNVANDWVNGANPSGAWSFGWIEPNSDGTFNLFPTFRNNGTCGYKLDKATCFSQHNGFVPTPSVAKVQGKKPVHFVNLDTVWTLPTDVVILRPDVLSGSYAAVQYKVPKSGFRTVSGYAELMDITSVGGWLHIYRNGVEVQVKEVTSFYKDPIAHFQFTGHMKAGDTITWAMEPRGVDSAYMDAILLYVRALR